MISSLDIDDFLRFALTRPVIDVRSPGEFLKGHIPGAVNICLFDDDERAEIGKLYHQSGSEKAFGRGMELVSPKLSRLVGYAAAIAPGKKVLVNCWRGGIRSESFAFLLQTSGFDVCTLKGGYKAFRRKVTESFDQPVPLIVLGGMTGSGKTKYLNLLSGCGVQTIDLENIAHHKGSVFGAIGQSGQPGTEQFQNDLYFRWKELDKSRLILIEDENMDIGAVSLPASLYRQMRVAPLINLQVSRGKRAARLANEYSAGDDELRTAVTRLERRLGSEHMKRAVEAIGQGDYRKCAEILLVYYDKAYATSLAKREARAVFPLETENLCEADIVSAISGKAIALAESYYHVPAIQG